MRGEEPIIVDTEGNEYLYHSQIKVLMLKNNGNITSEHHNGVWPVPNHASAVFSHALLLCVVQMAIPYRSVTATLALGW
jgi:hypothetical protein